MRTLIARQALIDELEAGTESSTEEASFATSEACRLSVDTIKTYSRLRHLGLIRFCGFHAISHVTAAAHTLIACMLKSSNLAFEHRPDLLTAIDILLVFLSPFPHVETIAQLLVQLSRTLDHNHGSNSQSEAVAIRVLARRMARSPTRVEPPDRDVATSWPLWEDEDAQSLDIDPVLRLSDRPQPSQDALGNGQSSISETPLMSARQEDLSAFNAVNGSSAWLTQIPVESIESQWMNDASDHAVWGDSFSFLNDGLFSKL